MANHIPRSFIDDVLARTDIVELINSRVKLKKAGREYQACCPFHHEKTPPSPLVRKSSFTIVLAATHTAMRSAF